MCESHHMNCQEARPHEAYQPERVLIMEKLDKVELVREKCNVSYEEARNALEACDYDVLDAVVMLEQASEVTERRAASVPPAPEATYELPEVAGAAPESEPAPEAADHRNTKATTAWRRFCAKCKGLWEAGLEMSFIAERHGEELFALPVSLVVLGLLFCGASLWLLVIGLFFGCRYRIEGQGKVAETVNDAMGKVADAAETVKESIA